ADVRIADAKHFIAGHVVDLAVTPSDGRFELVLAAGDGFSLNQWTIQEQSFRDAVGNTPGSPWRLVLSRDDRTNRIAEVQPAPGTWVDLGDLALEAGCQLSVTVTDDQGHAISGAKVGLARDASPPGNSTAMIPSGETDADGRATLA